MRLVPYIAVVLTGLIALPGIAIAATISNDYYATQYDYREFFAATDGKPFQVVPAGNPFPGVDPETVTRALLPAMQAAKPRPALTFTYAKPSPPPSPYYRLVLVFDPANDLNANPVCAESNVRFRPTRPGIFYVYAIYCRNELALSYATAWTAATGPTDPRIEQLFRELFMVIFSDRYKRYGPIGRPIR